MKIAKEMKKKPNRFIIYCVIITQDVTPCVERYIFRSILIILKIFKDGNRLLPMQMRKFAEMLYIIFLSCAVTSVSRRCPCIGLYLYRSMIFLFFKSSYHIEASRMKTIKDVIPVYCNVSVTQ